MATGFDDLVEQLLYDVALTGTHGLGANELEKAVKAFYKSRKPTTPTQQASEEDLLFSDAPPTSTVVIDEPFLDAVWDWLQKHPEVIVKEVEGQSKSAGPRIFTTEERTWQVIAGHGVDYSRLPKLLFECLSVIAAHGPDGIFQPALTQITKQDKRSVPGRTDSLAEDGYIVKLPAYDGKNKTSLLKLRKFAEQDGTAKPISDLERTRMYPEAESVPEENGLNSNKTFDEVVQMLNDNGGTVAIVDLCRAYKLRKYTAIKAEFVRRLDKLVASECLRRVTAQVESGNNRYVTCLQLVREPTDRDRALFTGKVANQVPTNGESDGILDGVDLDTDDVAAGDEDLIDQDEGGETADSQPTGRIPPQWTPDIPQNNLIYNLVKKAGPAGISSMDLHKQSMGAFWKKSLDDLLLRLTDVWEISQPPHLRHLGIVRDTESQGKSSHFHFRTVPNFEKAVELGLTAWEAVTNGAGKPAFLEETPDLDQYGFPKLDPKLFADEEGRASLAECAKIPRKGRPLKGPKSTPRKAGRKPKRKGSSDSSTRTPITKSGIGTASTSGSTPTGRKRRKDAGIAKGPYGPRGPNKKRRSSKSGVVNEGGVDAIEEPDSLDNSVRTAGKRSTDAARMDDSSKSRKAQKISNAISTPDQIDGNHDGLQTIFEARDPNTTAQGSPVSQLVSVNSPRAIAMRFEGWHRPGRKPNTKIVAIKSRRLQGFPWSTPHGTSSVGPADDISPDDREYTTVSTSEQPASGSTILQSETEPPRKKRKVQDASLPTADLGWMSADAAAAAKSLAGSVVDGTLYDKEYVVAHPNEKFHHRGHGRYVRVSRKPNTSLDSVSGGDTAVTTPAGPITDGALYSKEYVDAHPDEEFHHRGQGRYARGPRKSNASLGAISGDNVMTTTPAPIEKDTLYDKEYFDAQLNEQSHHRGQDQYAHGPGKQSSEKDSTDDPGVDRVKLFDKAYVEAHPDETFHHRGQGRWARGPKKSGQQSKNDMVPLNAVRSSLNTADVSSMQEQENVASDSRASLVAKLPLRRSLLERFIEERSKTSTGVHDPIVMQSRIVSLPLRHDDTRPLQSADRQSRIVTLPLPETLRSNSDFGDSNSDVETDNYEQLEPVSGSVDAPLNSDEQGSVLKLPLKRSWASANVDDPTRGMQIGSPVSTQSSVWPTFGLNIVRPYMLSTIATAPTRADALPDELTANSSASSDTTKRQPRLSRESKNDVSQSNGLPELLPADIEDDDDFIVERETQKAGVSRSTGFTHLHRIQIVMETMEKAGGVFPGDHEMWYPFTTAWQKKHPHFPDRRTVENTVALQLKQGKLKKFSFRFEDKNRRSIQRHILTLPDISPSSAKAKEVQQAIIASYPYRYLPKEVHITKNLRDRARHTTVTQGGRRRKDDHGIKDPDTNYTPGPWGERRPRSGVSFDLKPQVGPIQTPKVQRVASFTPRSILKIKDTADELVDLEDDDFHSTSGAETDSDSGVEDSDEDEEYFSEVSPDQMALQGSFHLDRYKHKVRAPPRPHQGSRPMRTFKLDLDLPSLSSSAMSTPSSASTPRRPSTTQKIESPLQIFHTPTGTFGTLFNGKRKAGRRPKELDATNFYFGQAPKDLKDIRKRALSIGHRPARPSDSRFSHFKNDIDGVSEWEQSVSAEDQTLQRADHRVFINHRLKQPHVVSTQSNAEFGFDFVDGSLKPFHLENERKRQSARPTPSKLQMPTASASIQPTSTPFVPYTSPYASPWDGPFALPSPPTAINGNGTTAPSATFRHYTPLAPSSRGPEGSVPMSSASPAKTKRRYEYKTRNKATRRPSAKSIDATAQIIDRDSDDDYRPSRKRAARNNTEAQSSGARQGRKKKTTYANFGAHDFRRLALAVALARTICGGTENMQTTNYEVVALALGSQYEVEELQYHWQSHKKFGYDRSWAIKAQQMMFEPFLQAYESDELPKVDFEDLQATDWPSLLQWTENVILPLVDGSALDELPTDRVEVQIVAMDDLDGSAEEATADSRQFDATTSTKRFIAPVRQRGQNRSKASTKLDQNHTMEKSWIRAIMATPDEVYNETVAAQKLSSITAQVLETATQEMLDTKMIKWKKAERQQPGRSYEISQHVLSQFDRWSKQHGSGYVKSLLEARQFILRQFELYDRVELPTDVSDCQITVLTEMVAQGQLSMTPVLPERNDDLTAPWPKLSKWGHINGTYDTDPNELPSMDIKVVYKRTPMFTTAHGLKSGVAAPTKVPVLSGEVGMRIPFWVDINGNPINEMWQKVMESVLYLLVHAPGCTAKSIERAHDSKLWEWEIDLVLKWMKEVGLATDVANGGWRASEWWYCASILMD